MKYCNRKKIERGMSPDKKYYIEDQDGSKYLLRIRGNKKLLMKEKVLHLNNQLFNINNNIAQGISIKQSTNKNYSFFEWVEGDDLEFVINELSLKEQYLCGIQAADILKDVHSIKINTPSNDFNALFVYNTVRKFRKIFKDKKHFILATDYVLDNYELFDFESSNYLHTDFHIGNFILKDKQVKMIDFENFEVGEGYRDLTMLQSYNRSVNTMFCTGILDGYGVNNDVKWRKFTLYTTLYMMLGLIWASKKNLKFYENKLKMFEVFLIDFKYLTTDIPTWHKENKIKIERTQINVS